MTTDKTANTEIGKRPVRRTEINATYFGGSLRDSVDVVRASDYDALIEQRDRLLNVFALDEPWPLRDVLDKLRAATAHLLDVHSCDTHGHEEFRTAMRQAETLIGRIDLALARSGEHGK